MRPEDREGPEVVVPVQPLVVKALGGGHDNLSPSRGFNARDPSSLPDIIEERIQQGGKLGDVVRRYQRGVFLGKGGFAKVYQVRELESDRIFACKVVEKETVTRLKAKKKLLTEIRLHRGLRHRHVVRFERFFEDDLRVYILLELCASGTLMDLVRRRKRLTEQEARYYLLQIIDGLYYMHDRWIIHRDIKLGNLFLSEKMEIKIGDFGLATQLAYDRERKKTICGTPNYIAPEILSSGAEGGGHSFEADVWSIGVVLYTLLIGRPPFETSNVRTTYRRIRTTTYSFPAEVPLSREARSLISRILTELPSDRPSLDEIRSHCFFTANTVPKRLSTSTLTTQPVLDPETQREILRDTTTTHVDRAEPIRAEVPKPENPGSPEPCSSVPDSPAQEKKLEKPVLHKRVPPLGPVGLEVSPKEQKARHLTPNSLVDVDIEEEERKVLLRTYHELSASFATLAAKQQVLGGKAQTLTESTELTAAAGGLWVSKWVDYSSKYGIGYQMCDGRFGVFFNDASKLVYSDPKTVSYFEKRRTLDGTHIESSMTFPAEDHPERVRKKMTLLRHFKDYLNLHTSRGQEDPVECGTFPIAMESPLYVRKWYRTKCAIIFRLSNLTIQVDFSDKSEIILSTQASVVTYRTKAGKRSTFSLASIPNSPDLVKRLRYTNEIIEQIVSSGR